MEPKFNKPRVFLSHSKIDSVFIERLADDLRKCQIEPWLDTEEIRHGRSWQDSIFEYGLPTCDAILVYFTEFSIQSPIVKKEMDVGLLQKLKDSNVAFLPYVDNIEIRNSLRPDIQALQTPEWNENNYQSLLARVVAEIWRSFLERTVAAATKDERLRRTELELELEKNRSQNENIFSTAENAEFDYIWATINKTIPLVINKMRRDAKLRESELAASYAIRIDLSTLIARLTDYYQEGLVWRYIDYGIGQEGAEFLGILPQSKEDNITYYIQMEGLPDMTEQLLMFGLVESYPYSTEFGSSHRLTYSLIFSKKYFRFRYWLAYNNKLPNAIRFE